MKTRIPAIIFAFGLLITSTAIAKETGSASEEVKKIRDQINSKRIDLS